MSKAHCSVCVKFFSGLARVCEVGQQIRGVRARQFLVDEVLVTQKIRALFVSQKGELCSACTALYAAVAASYDAKYKGGRSSNLVFK